VLLSVHLVSAALTKPCLAGGQDGLYLGFALGPLLFPDNETRNAVTVKFDTGVGFGAMIGYKLSNLRLEGELAYQTVEGTSTNNVNADFDTVRFTGAAYYDFDLGVLQPYLGGGMGIANLDSGGSSFENKDTAFTWHGETGLTIYLTNQLAILPTYRYEWTDTDLGRFGEALTHTLSELRSATSFRLRPGKLAMNPTRKSRHHPICTLDATNTIRFTNTIQTTRFTPDHVPVNTSPSLNPSLVKRPSRSNATVAAGRAPAAHLSTQNRFSDPVLDCESPFCTFS
jgi:hypothetical protein